MGNVYSTKQCSICMHRRATMSLKCKHRFCKQCVNAWFDSCLKNIEHKSCPDCRNIEEKSEIREMLVGDLGWIIELLRNDSSKDHITTIQRLLDHI